MGRVLSFEKLNSGADPVDMKGKATRPAAETRALAGPA